MRVLRTLSFPLLLALALLCVYWEPVRLDPLLGRDDQELVDPLRSVRSVSDYLEAVRSNVILDRQPVRDLSFWVDLRLGEWLGVGTLHLTNLLVWLAIVLVAGSALRRVRPDSWGSRAVLALFALHPVVANSVAWISARKHLLAVLFLLLATRELLRLTTDPQRKRWVSALLISGWYALAMASQPLGLLWPLWAALWVWLQSPRESRRSHLGVLLGCVPLLLAAAWVNQAYYSGPYLLRYGNAKLTDGGFGITVLSLGRYAFQLVAPLRLSVQYYPGSTLNLVGALLAPALAFLAFKLGPRRDVAAWLGFILFPLALVSIRMTNIFVSDTYLLLPAFGAAALATVLVHELGPRLAPMWRPAALGLAAVLLLAFGFGSWRQAKSWLSDRALWEHAYATEPTPQSLAKHAQYQLTDGKVEEALELALELKQWNPGERHLPMLLARSVYLHPGLSVADKLRFLETEGIRSPWTQYHAALLFAQQGDSTRAFELLQPLVGWSAVDRETLLAQAAQACTRTPRTDCAQWLSEQRAVVTPPLDAARLDTVLAQLGLRPDLQTVAAPVP
ncbi:hypothetical protein [Archangium sp.]|uniref:hypothetical protein n=1 Tax=Archangium sp. TaxID=1872627 RepID=UPI00286A0A70|nr:hypothetical protein [Archangium sp.]